MSETSEWIEACDLDDIPVGGARALHPRDCHVAVFRTGERSLHAVDNRCPHEGYPLAKGYVTDGVVTCPWHNYKFRLDDGACLMGDEAVRVFPLRLRGDRVEIDVAPPDPAKEVPRLWASLDEGLSERRMGQVARNVVRLLQLGVTPPEIALGAARYDAERAKWGTTHALPVAVDVLPLAARAEGVEAVLPLMQAFDMASEPHVRRPLRPTPAPSDPGGDPAAAGARLRALVEAERADEAEALLRGALQAGWGREVVEPWLLRLCADHFLDFGHRLIYQVKVFDLLEVVGWGHAEALLPAHLLGITSGTREDTLPEWLWFRRWVDTLDLDAAWAARRDGYDEAAAGALYAALVDGSRDGLKHTLGEQLAAGLCLDAALDALVAAASERMLRFEVRHDADPTLQDDWLDVTHLLTFASAARQGVARLREPAALRFVLHAARFVQNARPLDGEARLPAPRPSSPEELLAAVAARRGDEAVARARGYLSEGGDAGALRGALDDAILDDAAVRPIVVGHLIKTTAAAFDERDRMLGPGGAPAGRDAPVLAAVRLLASPVKERRMRRVCHEAVRFLVEGKVPRSLTS